MPKRFDEDGNPLPGPAPGEPNAWCTCRTEKVPDTTAEHPCIQDGQEVRIVMDDWEEDMCCSFGQPEHIGYCVLDALARDEDGNLLPPPPPGKPNGRCKCDSKKEKGPDQDCIPDGQRFKLVQEKGEDLHGSNHGKCCSHGQPGHTFECVGMPKGFDEDGNPLPGPAPGEPNAMCECGTKEAPDTPDEEEE